jgi:ribonuclease HII
LKAADPQVDTAAIVYPNLALEYAAADEYATTLIAGLDEAGRGAIAGPVVAAAVILPFTRLSLQEDLKGVNDSKQLSTRQRQALEPIVKACALTWGIGLATSEEIDRLGIIPANALAMTMALESLEPAPEFLLLDGRMRLPNLPLPQTSVIRGDALSLSIAAASILAKVARDRLMARFDEDYPAYGFGRHKGYCTRAHASTLESLGPCPIHRRSFAPLRPSLL